MSDSTKKGEGSLTIKIALVFFCGVNNNTPDAEGIRRLQMAVALYTDGQANKIMVSGGYRNSVRLASLYARYLRNFFKISPQDIIIEDESNSTASNLAKSVAVLTKVEKDYGDIELVYLITNYRHLRRVRYLVARMRNWAWFAKEQPIEPDPKVSPRLIELIKLIITILDPFETTWLTKRFLKNRAETNR